MAWLKLYLYSFNNNDYLDSKDRFVAVLDDAEQERFHRFKFDHSRWAFAAARWLAKTQLGKLLDTDPRAIRFSYNDNGKPYLDGDSQPKFSISHTDSCVAVALANCDVGVDVELRNRRSQPWRNAQAFLNENVAKPIEQASNEMLQQAMFARYWTVMESRVKLSGESLFGIKQSFGKDLPILDKDGYVSDGRYHYFTTVLSNGEQLGLGMAEKPALAIAMYCENGVFNEDKSLIQRLGISERNDVRSGSRNG